MAEKPRWERVAGWEHDEVHQKRKLTSELRFASIPAPDDESAEILLTTQAYPVNAISRIDPQDDYQMRLDLDVQDYVSKHIPGARVTSIAANGFAPFWHPDTGQRVHIGGLWLYFRNQTDTQDSNAAWYLVRYEDGSYQHGRVFDPNHPIPNRGVQGGLRDARHDLRITLPRRSRSRDLLRRVQLRHAPHRRETCQHSMDLQSNPPSSLSRVNRS